jgi:hypothetical protein
MHCTPLLEGLITCTTLLFWRDSLHALHSSFGGTHAYRPGELLGPGILPVDPPVGPPNSLANNSFNMWLIWSPVEYNLLNELFYCIELSKNVATIVNIYL